MLASIDPLYLGVRGGENNKFTPNGDKNSFVASAMNAEPLSVFRTQYLHKNRHRMRYHEYLAKGYPIASGVIEGIWHCCASSL
jgi:hypothetical protein